MQEYAITNSRVNYLDESTKTYLRLSEVNHEGSGDFSADVSNLNTSTTALASFDFDGINYLNQNKIALDAVIEMNLPLQRYTFKENEPSSEREMFSLNKSSASSYFSKKVFVNAM